MLVERKPSPSRKEQQKNFGNRAQSGLVIVEVICSQYATSSIMIRNGSVKNGETQNGE